MIIEGYFSSVLHKNKCCRYSLESPYHVVRTHYNRRVDSNEYPRGVSNKYPQHIFYGEISKIIS